MIRSDTSWINCFHLTLRGTTAFRNWPKAVQGMLIILHSVCMRETFLIKRVYTKVLTLSKLLCLVVFWHSIPDGVYLDHPGSGITIYDTGMDNSDAIFSEDLETIPITLIPTDVTYNHGKMVAVSKGYISYAAKGKSPVMLFLYIYRINHH